MLKTTCLQYFHQIRIKDSWTVVKAYIELIKQHHPDKGEESNMSYLLNEAKDTLLKNLHSNNDRTVAVIVTNALTKYREAERKEQELKTEVHNLIHEHSSKPKSRIETYRNLSIIITFLAALVTFIGSTTNSFLDSSTNTTPSSDFIINTLLKDYSLYDRHNYNLDSAYTAQTEYRLDSLYATNSFYKKRVDEAYSYEMRSQKALIKQAKLILLLFTAMGGILIAYIQMRLKRYEHLLESFKSKIDQKAKLKKLLRLVCKEHERLPMIISETQLYERIKKIFSSYQFDFMYELEEAIKLGKRLEIEDLEKIIVLKFKEKSLIEETAPDNESDETFYTLKA